MPLTKQAIKKLRRDRERSQTRAVEEKKLQSLIKTMRKNPSQKALTSVFSSLDKAAKIHIAHPNKVSRLKSRLTKLLAKK